MKQRHASLTVTHAHVYEDDEANFRCAVCRGPGGYLVKKNAPRGCWKVSGKQTNGGAPMSLRSRAGGEFIREIVLRERDRLPPHPHELRLLKMLVEGINYKTAPPTGRDL